MKDDKRNLHFSSRRLQSVIAVGFALISILGISYAARTTSDPSQQQVLRLETRMNQIEQRLNFLETSLRNLEQQSRTRSVPSQSVNQEDLNLLRSVIQTLEQRLAYDECGLAKLDERTLKQDARAARRQSGADSKDPCRLNFDEPLRLPDRRE